MFKRILEGMFKELDITEESDQVLYLRHLQGWGRMLWSSYRENDIDVDYAHVNAQNAYLLRYFCFYTQIVPKMLDYLSEDHAMHLPKTELLHPIFFGCGPAPEVLGLMLYLRDHQQGKCKVSGSLVDIAADSWLYSRGLNFKYLVPQVYDPSLYEFDSLQACITDKDLLDKVSVERSHLVVFQNCFNEIPAEKYDLLFRNIGSIVERLSPGALLLFIDRKGYGSTDAIFERLINGGRNSDMVNEVGILTGTLPTGNLLDTVPDIILQNLYYRIGDIEPDWDTNGLIFAKNTRTVSIAFQKCASTD